MDSNRIGEERISSARVQLNRINPGVEVEAYAEKIEYDNAAPWVEEADVVIDARYDFPERYTLNKLYVDQKKIMIEAAMSGFEISLTTIKPGETACLSCMFPTQDEGWEPLDFPVLGATSGIAGCLAAIEAIKVLTGIGVPYYNKLYRFDTRQFHSYTFGLKRDPCCSHCGITEVKAV